MAISHNHKKTKRFKKNAREKWYFAVQVLPAN